MTKPKVKTKFLQLAIEPEQRCRFLKKPGSKE